MDCKHEFEETERFHAKGLADRCSYVPSEDIAKIERILFGVVTILYVCKECGTPKSIEALGSSNGDA